MSAQTPRGLPPIHEAAFPELQSWDPSDTDLISPDPEHRSSLSTFSENAKSLEINEGSRSDGGILTRAVNGITRAVDWIKNNPQLVAKGLVVLLITGGLLAASAASFGVAIPILIATWGSFPAGACTLFGVGTGLALGAFMSFPSGKREDEKQKIYDNMRIKTDTPFKDIRLYIKDSLKNAAGLAIACGALAFCGSMGIPVPSHL